MWKEPDSVFSNSEEVKSVFRALGVKSARMSILERMRWVAEDKHNVDFQQYPLTTPWPAPEGPHPAFCLLSCPGGAHHPLPSLKARVKLREHPYLKGCAEQFHNVGRVFLEHPDLRDREVLVQLLQRDRSSLS